MNLASLVCCELSMSKILDGSSSAVESVSFSIVILAVMTARAYFSLIYGGTTDLYSPCKVVRCSFVPVDSVASCPNICGMISVVGMLEGCPDVGNVEGSDSCLVADPVCDCGSLDARAAGRSPGIDAASCYGPSFGACGVTSPSLLSWPVEDIDSDCRVVDG